MTDKQVVTIRPDRVRELKLGAAKRFLEDSGSIIDDIPPYFPENNRRAERCNETILVKSRTVIAEVSVMCKMDGCKKL